MEQRRFDNTHGFIALVSVLLISAIAMSVALSLLLLGIGSSRTSLVIQQEKQATALAHTCGEIALQAVHDDTTYTGSVTQTIGTGTCTYTVNGTTTKTINATGTVGAITRTVDISSGDLIPDITINSWQEVQ